MTKDKTGDEMLVFVQWMEFIEWLLQRTEKYPRRARFSFAMRIENIALDVVEDLVEARYTKERGAILKRANLKLEKLRILLRLSYKMRYLSVNGYEFAIRRIDEVGRMLGGWRKV